MLKKVGDWDKVERLVKAIAPEMVRAKNLSLKRWGLKAEAIAKKHISAQDLGWRPLQPATIANKVRRGLSENILVMTSTYFQSITSWAESKAGFMRTDNGKVKKQFTASGKETGTAYAGVISGVLSKDGKTDLSWLARLHEYGSESGRIPARPLWEPTFQEVMAWHKLNNQPENIFALNMKKYGV